MQDSDAMMNADVEVKVEEDNEAESETDGLNGLDVQQEYVRCLTVNRPGDHDDSLANRSQALIRNAETPALKLHLLVEDTRCPFLQRKRTGMFTSSHCLSAESCSLVLWLLPHRKTSSKNLQRPCQTSCATGSYDLSSARNVINHIPTARITFSMSARHGPLVMSEC